MARVGALVVLAVLVVGAIGVAFFVAPAPDDVRHEVVVRNNDDRDHHVEVTVENSEGEQVYSRQQNVSAGEDWDVLAQERAGNYTLFVQIVDGAAAETGYELPLADGDRTSFTVVRVESSSTIDTSTYWQE